jgi:membrane associated rhomboid family serine protease
MNGQRTLFEELKYQLKFGGTHIQLLFINAGVFVFIGVITVIGRLTNTDEQTQSILAQFFTLDTDFTGFIKSPWTIITSIFAHFSFLHFLSNMLFLYFSGSMFIQFFTGRRLIHVYVLGGIFGGIFELIAHALFPAFANPQMQTVIVGASGSIMAIFVAMAFYRPNLQVNLFGILPVRLIVIAGLYILYDVLSIGANDNIAHFAHIGGIFIGYLSIRNLHSSKNIINFSEKITQQFRLYFASIGKKSPKMKVKKGGSRVKTDEEYNAEKKQKQIETDKILDKIAKSGYESLTKKEKDFLFSQSKK